MIGVAMHIKYTLIEIIFLLQFEAVYNSKLDPSNHILYICI